MTGLAAFLVGGSVLVFLGLPAPRSVPTGTSVEGRRPGAGVARWLVLLIGLLLLVSAGLVAALGGMAGTFVAHRWWARRGRARARQQERDGAAEALSVLASELRAGRPPVIALAGAAEVAVGPLAAALEGASRGANLGADPVAVLLAKAEASAVPGLVRGLAACWQVCAGTGSSLAAAVERLADGLAAEQAQRLIVEAELAGPRATAAVLAVLPLAGIALAAGLGAQPGRVLLKTPVGLTCLALGIALDALGLWWTGRLVASAGGAR